MFERFFPDEPGFARSFEETIGARLLSPAAIQGWLLAWSGDPRRAAQAEDIAADRIGAEMRVP